MLYIAVDFVNSCQTILPTALWNTNWMYICYPLLYQTSKEYTCPALYCSVLPTVVLKPAPCCTEHQRDVHILPSTASRTSPCRYTCPALYFIKHKRDGYTNVTHGCIKACFVLYHTSKKMCKFLVWCSIHVEILLNRGRPWGSVHAYATTSGKQGINGV